MSGYGKPKVGETAKEIRARGWVVAEEVPDRAVVSGRVRAAGCARFGIFEWDHGLPIFHGVPVIRTDEAPLFDDRGLPIEYAIRKTEHGEEIIVHPSKWDDFCEAAVMAGELRGRNN